MHELILSCEHAGNRVPTEWQNLFGSDSHVLQTHRGYDPGTLELGNFLADYFKVELRWTDVTRLLVDCNRSLKHPRLYSEWSRELAVDQKLEILDRYYHPHRQSVTQAIESSLSSRSPALHNLPVLHIGVHSFTPVWEGVERTVDIGLLYDPARRPEQQFCRRWQQLLRGQAPNLRVRCNQPYLGKADGLTTALRRRFFPESYLGVELEVNQAIVQKGGSEWHQVKEALKVTLETLQSEGTFG